MLKFRFNGADGYMIETDTLTSGMIGKTVKLEFSSDWDNLQKTAVFTAGPTTIDVLNVTDEAVIPHEVLRNFGDRLYVGIYGVAEDGKVTPTVYARGPRISRGANPSGDESTDPSLPVWAQLESRVSYLEKNGTGGGGNDSGQNVELDTTLTQRGKAADAKAVGDALASKLNAVMVSPDGSKWRISIGNDGVLISEKIIIEIPATGISLSASTLTFANSANQTIKATLTPADSTDAVIWETSNPAVATVSNGVVTPISNGSCTIKATAGSVSASCAITVDVAVVETYSITRNLTNVMHFDDSSVIGGGSELLECFVSSDECTMDSATATVTMGGQDITETAWDNGVVNIAEVTGDVVINIHAVKVNYVVPPIEDLEVQLHEGSLLLKKYTGAEKAIVTPTTLTYNGTEYSLENGKLKLWQFNTGTAEHFKDVGLPYFQSRYASIQESIKTFIPYGDSFVTAKGKANLEKIPIYNALDCSTYSAGDVYNFGGTGIRTAQHLILPEEQTSITWLFANATKLVDGGTIPARITNINRTFIGCTSLRRVRIEGREFTSTEYWAYQVKNLELTCYPDSSLFASLRYNPDITWSFRDIDGGAINRILCFGDSLSATTYEQALTNLCPTNSMVNSCGRGGFTSEQIYQMMVEGTYDKLLKDSVIVIWHGTNGYGADGCDGVTAKMAAALDGNQRYLLIPPTAQGAGDEVYESWVAAYGAEHVMSMGDWFESNGYTVSDYQTDGIHFTADGYALVAQAIHEKIQHWL